ncbi:hypothetical protein OCAR_4810 [Afipia carboxidovorans OM5]|uniref:Uncharacterized protein n=1 Tax=Afipia carboxidovorans (strain ATCC 49405 / DSM 1227 / KCTC 32145 / OM5) TaxID=504832 RepID=B6JDL7_AFIC5|nr:hypothetical protein [Afipia carboxidovorans]ACI91947.1 hypothetical protein OCAR_4810 [Afipia carboxidovorans OM5]AEI04194.1 hypothetical protein OCA4_c30880 [Afipia carboxidovorans OM4]AEI07824.1 hypothetical protein OCA5_c31400 [Afipia carboxidovorans OM5]
MLTRRAFGSALVGAGASWVEISAAGARRAATPLLIPRLIDTRTNGGKVSLTIGSAPDNPIRGVTNLVGVTNLKLGLVTRKLL